MKILELNSITGEDTLLYYRRNYTATAKLQLFSSTKDVHIAFTIEVGPLGNKVIYVEYPSGTDFDYPILPVTKSLKEKILELDNNGNLPI